MKSVHERYNFKPFIGSSHLWALNRMLKLPTTSKVLDIGPGCGAIGALLKDSGYSECYAVEIDEEARNRLKDTYKQIEADIDNFKDKQFDLILLLDVLEHLTNPEEYLQKVESHLTPNGTILISVPNITHWSVRLLILFGYFPQYDRGILDRTHHQFFTRVRLKNLIKNTPRLTLLEQGASIEPAEFVFPEFITKNFIFKTLKKIHLKLAEAIPGLFAYQLLAKVSKT